MLSECKSVFGRIHRHHHHRRHPSRTFEIIKEIYFKNCGNPIQVCGGLLGTFLLSGGKGLLSRRRPLLVASSLLCSASMLALAAITHFCQGVISFISQKNKIKVLFFFQKEHLWWCLRLVLPGPPRPLLPLLHGRPRPSALGAHRGTAIE